MRCSKSIISLFCNEFNKFDNTGTRMLDSFYHMTLKLLKDRIFVVKTLIHLSITQLHYQPYTSKTTKVQTTRHNFTYVVGN